MAPSTVKIYTVTGSRWSSQHLEIQQGGVPFLWVNSNNKFGPWKEPYITIHEQNQSGEIVAAAKMGTAGWSRHLKIWLGNPDCTDLTTWPIVKCKGKSAYEYRFHVGKQEFAWRRTRSKQLGSRGKDHRDFKLVAISSPTVRYRKIEVHTMEDEKCILDMSEDEIRDDASQRMNDNECQKADERVVAVYYQDPFYKSNSREAKINFFEHLSKETEMWCLAAVLGLQEKISQNQNIMMLSSLSYGGCLWWLGNYI